MGADTTAESLCLSSDGVSRVRSIGSGLKTLSPQETQNLAACGNRFPHLWQYIFDPLRSLIIGAEEEGSYLTFSCAR